MAARVDGTEKRGCCFAYGPVPEPAVQENSVALLDTLHKALEGSICNKEPFSEANPVLPAMTQQAVLGEVDFCPQVRFCSADSTGQGQGLLSVFGLRKRSRARERGWAEPSPDSDNVQRHFCHNKEKLLVPSGGGSGWCLGQHGAAPNVNCPLTVRPWPALKGCCGAV